MKYIVVSLQNQGLSYLFRSDPRKSSDQFKQLGCLLGYCMLPNCEFGGKTPKDFG